MLSETVDENRLKKFLIREDTNNNDIIKVDFNDFSENAEKIEHAHDVNISQRVKQKKKKINKNSFFLFFVFEKNNTQ